MSICKIVGEDLKKIETLFGEWDETLIWSCLEGGMGVAYADNNINPTSGQMVVADFCFYAGEPSKDLIKHKPEEHKSEFVIIVPQNMRWAKMIEEVYGDQAKKVIRYAIKKEPDVFDQNKLKAIVASIDKEYKIEFIDQEKYETTKENTWSSDLCSQFEDYEDYARRGLGVVATHNGEVVSGASSYTVYKDGIEIEIDTRKDYRRKGLAQACGAKLILECQERNLYPSWDAQNKGSVALAESLGYHFDKEYIAYEINGFGHFLQE